MSPFQVPGKVDEYLHVGFAVVAVGGFHHIFSKWKSELGDETVRNSGLWLML